MNSPVISLSLVQLALAFLPVAATLAILFFWSYGTGNALYALGRMVLQLLAIGYVLAWIFGTGSGWLILLVLLGMMTASAWISVGTVPGHRRELLLSAWLSIAAGGGFTLLLITQLVLQLKPWYLPHYMVPLAGMVFANAMTAASPVVNSLLAVGLVSLPGMMTGQILSGVSPLIASRYQIMVMCMIFASAGLSTALFLALIRRRVVVRAVT